MPKIKSASGEADAVALRVPFIANPDLPRRFELDAPLNGPQPETFFALRPEGLWIIPPSKLRSAFSRIQLFRRCDFMLARG